jgi:dTDP-4-dehydrorhamnose 3,5-epimerase
MKFKKLTLKGAYLIELESRKDHRGYFARAFCRNEFASEGIDFQIVQSNLSYSEHVHTLRGMHFQTGDAAEKKIVKCMKGEILDVIIDLRKDSESYGHYYSAVLNEENNLMMFVPEGFAHGFLTLRPHTIVFYQVSNFYNSESEGAIRWNDPNFAIDWPVSDPVISERDASHPDYIL